MDRYWVIAEACPQTACCADGSPFNFPGMKIVPALAIIAIIWILAHATAWEFAVNGIVLVVASVLYFLRAKLQRA